MIHNDAELELNRAALKDIEAALFALKRKLEAHNPALFNSMAESYYKDIIAIRSEIDTYLGMEAIEKSSIPLWLVMRGENISTNDSPASGGEKEI